MKSSFCCIITLKDENSQVRSVIWRSTAQRLRFKLKQGMKLLCCGGVEVYGPRGSYQLIVNRAQPVGLGALQLAFQQLHEKLSKEGLFSPDRKQSLPHFPKRIGFVTSPSGAAIHDFLEAAQDLWRDVEIIIIPARVQGELATQDIVNGIQAAQKISPQLDIVVIGRGGGSIEDLWSFNEEAVVRAIGQCNLPTVSAVGHEVDVTLSDLVADARALTPTHAAQLILPNSAELESRVDQLSKRVRQAAFSRITRAKQILDQLSNRRLFLQPHSLHQQRRQIVDELETRGHRAAFRFVQNQRQRLANLARAAEALSPLNVLQRGYTVTRKTDDQSAVRKSSQLKIGDEIQTLLEEGQAISVVKEIDDTTLR